VPPSGGLKEAGRAARNQREREVILAALERCDWKKSSAARQLGISRQTLDQKIRLFGLTPFIERGKRR
jgi:transcriptional regulator of acetoin/glycerol metabolism